MNNYQQLTQEDLEKILVCVEALIRDSSPFEGDKIFCHIGALKHILAGKRCNDWKYT